jgi:ABC-type lipoprotein export system ATPase subunit
VTEPILELSDVCKDYRGLRPLRVEHFALLAGESAAILGWDEQAAEAFVHLLTGATLPDRGDVKVFGRSTRSIADSDQWLALVDRFGIVSERAVLLEGLSVVQNLAVPFSLDIEPPPPDVRRRAALLARDAGLPEATWDVRAAELDGASRVSVRLGRALAHEPDVLLLEHPTARVSRPDVDMLAHRVRAAARRRGASIVAVTADAAFAASVASLVLRSDLRTGRLTRARQSWFRSR